MSELKTDKKIEKVDWSDHTDDDIVEHLIINKAVPIGDDGEVSVQEEYIESKRYNRQAYINSFRNDVGILNILKKVEQGLINPLILQARAEQCLDISNMPNDPGDAMKMVDDARKTFAKLPEDLRGKMDYETFCKEFTQTMFDAYIESKTKKSEVKEDVK